MGWASNGLEGFFENILFNALGLEAELKGYQYVSGGCINNAVRLDTADGPFFLKWNEAADQDMFEKEYKGLQQLIKTDGLAVPKPIQFGEYEQKTYLLLEYLRVHRQSSDYWEELGRGLAHIHAHTQATFGFGHDNYIGRLHQRNAATSNWIDFFIEHRLEVQLGLALYNGHIDKTYADRFRLLYSVLPEQLPQEKPALIHGDLWSGNVMPGHHGHPTIFDPAVYYGHREMELAFTRLFGGFDKQFYLTYNEVFPLMPGFTQRADLYNLYPLLVHVNLFGTSYLSGIDRTLRQYI